MRHDVHRPGAINPADYDWVCFQYYGASDLGAILAMRVERERFAAHRAQTHGEFSKHEHGGICHICGQGNIVYANVFYHRPTNSYIVTGEDCAAKMDLAVNGNPDAFRKAISNALEAIAGKKKAKAILEAAGLLRCWDIYTAENRDGYAWEEVTITDIVGKLIRYGSISEKQQNFLRNLLVKIDNRAEVEAKKKAEADAAAPCPSGRVWITGVILTTKEAPGYTRWSGTVTKMLVRDDSGFKVYGTLPDNGGWIIERGKTRIRFSADVTPSPDDPKFGFFKRPTKAEVLG